MQTECGWEKANKHHHYHHHRHKGHYECTRDGSPPAPAASNAPKENRPVHHLLGMFGCTYLFYLVLTFTVDSPFYLNFRFLVDYGTTNAHPGNFPRRAMALIPLK